MPRFNYVKRRHCFAWQPWAIVHSRRPARRLSVDFCNPWVEVIAIVPLTRPPC